MIFKKPPSRVDAVIVMPPQELAAFVMGGAEIIGEANEEGVYYWLRDGRWLMVEVVENVM